MTKEQKVASLKFLEVIVTSVVIILEITFVNFLNSISINGPIPFGPNLIIIPISFIVIVGIVLFFSTKIEKIIEKIEKEDKKN